MGGCRQDYYYFCKTYPWKMELRKDSSCKFIWLDMNIVKKKMISKKQNVYEIPSVELLDLVPLNLLAGFSGDAEFYDYEDDGQIEPYNG